MRWNRELTSAKDDLGFDRELTVIHRAVWCWRRGSSDGHLQSAVFDAKLAVRGDQCRSETRLETFIN